MSRKTRTRPMREELTYPLNMQRAYNSSPREKWTVLRLKMWRAQQHVARRLRAIKRMSAVGRQKLELFSAKLREHVVRFGKEAAVFLLSTNCLSNRFTTATAEQMVTGVSDGLRQRPGEEVMNTVTNRVYQIARQWTTNVTTSMFRGPRIVIGESCVLCGESDHNSLDCSSRFSSQLAAEFWHIVSARRRLLDVSDSLDHRGDDVDRIRIGLMKIEALRRRRAERIVALSTRAIGRHIGPLGTLLHRLNSIGRLVDTAWYIGTGTRLVPRYRSERILHDQLTTTAGLLAFVDGIRRAEELVTPEIAKVAETKDPEPTTTLDTSSVAPLSMEVRRAREIKMWSKFLVDLRLDVATARAGMESAPYWAWPGRGLDLVVSSVPSIPGLRQVGSMIYLNVTPGALNRISGLGATPIGGVPDETGPRYALRNTRGQWMEIVEDLEEYLLVTEDYVRSIGARGLHV